MELRKYLIFLILFLVLEGCAKDKSDVGGNDTVVAKADKDYVVTLKDLNKYVVDGHYLRRFNERSVAYKEALNRMIINRLKLFDFFDRKLDENQDLMNKISRYINYELMDKYFNKAFVGKYVNEKSEAEAYKEMGKEVICNEAILLFPADSTKKEIDSLKAIALKIGNGLSNNNNIDDLIKVYSLRNIRLNKQKKVTWSETMTDRVANVIFGLQKGFTRVIESGDGFHIVKVVDIKKVNLKPFEEEKNEIISQLQKGYYNLSNKAYDDYRNGLIDKSSIKWNKSGLDKIVKWSSENPQFYGGAYKDTIQNAISNGRDFEILSYNKGNVDLKEYLRLLEEIVIPNPNTILNSSNVKEFILNAIYDDNVVKAARKLGLQKELINPETNDPIIRDRLVYLYNQAVIDGSIPKLTPETLHEFYENHKDSIFYQLKVVYIYARIYSDSAEAAADINEIKKGKPFEKVKDSWFVKEYIRERDGSLKAYRTAGGDYLAKAAFALKLNECAGPIEYSDSTKGKQFAVIKCFKIQPEKQLTYDDVKGKRIEEEFKNYYHQKISAEVDETLKKKYNVKIFDDVLSKAIASESE